MDAPDGIICVSDSPRRNNNAMTCLLECRNTLHDVSDQRSSIAGVLWNFDAGN